MPPVKPIRAQDLHIVFEPLTAENFGQRNVVVSLAAGMLWYRQPESQDAYTRVAKRPAAPAKTAAGTARKKKLRAAVKKSTTIPKGSILRSDEFEGVLQSIKVRDACTVCASIASTGEPACIDFALKNGAVFTGQLRADFVRALNYSFFAASPVLVNLIKKHCYAAALSPAPAESADMRKTNYCIARMTELLPRTEILELQTLTMDGRYRIYGVPGKTRDEMDTMNQRELATCFRVFAYFDVPEDMGPDDMLVAYYSGKFKMLYGRINTPKDLIIGEA